MDAKIDKVVSQALNTSFALQYKFYSTANKLYANYLTQKTKLSKARQVIFHVPLRSPGASLLNVLHKYELESSIAENEFLYHCIENFDTDWLSLTHARNITIETVKNVLSDIHIHMNSFFLLFRHFFECTQETNTFTFHMTRQPSSVRDTRRLEKVKNKLRWIIYSATKSFRPPTSTSDLLLTYKEAKNDITGAFQSFLPKEIAAKISNFLFFDPVNYTT